MLTQAEVNKLDAILLAIGKDILELIACGIGAILKFAERLKVEDNIVVITYIYIYHRVEGAFLESNACIVFEVTKDFKNRQMLAVTERARGQEVKQVTKVHSEDGERCLNIDILRMKGVNHLEARLDSL